MTFELLIYCVANFVAYGSVREAQSNLLFPSLL